MICISIEHIECGCSKDSDTTQEEMGEEKEAIRRNLSLFYLIIIMIRSRKKKEKSSFAFLICYLIQTCLYIIYHEGFTKRGQQSSVGSMPTSTWSEINDRRWTECQETL